MGSLSMACDPVVTDGVKGTVRSLRLDHSIYMLTREGWIDGEEWTEWDFLMHENQVPGPAGRLMLVPDGSR
jgi:hypothetical protein